MSRISAAPIKATLLTGLCLFVVACGTQQVPDEPTVGDEAAVVTDTPPAAEPVSRPPAGDADLQLQTVLSGLQEPWGMDFLPDGSLLVTERSGAMMRVWPDSGESAPVHGVPRVARVGQGGLLDVAVEPVPGEEPRVYLSYSVSVEGGYTTRVARMRLWEDELVDYEELFTALPAYPTRRHFGSRLLLLDDYLFLTMGDRANRHGAQDLSVHNGKVMRLYRDGSVPGDNPFADVKGARPEIWTYGHRNAQGLAQNPRDGSLWISEHGPQGGDEINILRRGANYGWPVITYGEEYGGGAIGEGTHKEGMVQPEKYYTPSIGSCGIAFYTGDTYPGWPDSLLVAALRSTHINRISLDKAGLGDESRLFEKNRQRVRDVQQGPDGYIYALLGGDRLVRLLPAP